MVTIINGPRVTGGALGPPPKISKTTGTIFSKKARSIKDQISSIKINFHDNWSIYSEVIGMQSFLRKQWIYAKHHRYSLD